MFACPVCGYETLFRQGDGDSCFLCGWIDNGQTEQEADECYGVNTESLTQARVNFPKYYSYVRPHKDEHWFSMQKDVIEIQKKIMSLFREIDNTDSVDEKKRLRENIRGLAYWTKWEP